MKKSLIRPIAICLSTLLIPAMADEIKLKDGTTLTGKVISKTTENYLVEINVTKSIKDRKTIPASDVLFVSIETPEDKAFADVKPHLTSQDFDTEEQYKARIAKLQEFLTKFPSSKKAKTLTDAQAKLQNELVTISAGGIKWNNRMYSAEDYEVERYAIDSQKILFLMKRESQNQAWAFVLNQFDTMKKDFTSSQAMREALPLAKQALVSWTKELDAKNFDARQKQQKIDLDNLNANDRANTVQMLAQRSAALKAQIEQLKSDKQRWFPVDPNDKALVDQTNTQLDNELRNFASFQLPAMPEGDKAWSDSWNIVTTSKSRAAHNTAIEAARKAKIPDSYLKLLTAASLKTPPTEP